MLCTTRFLEASEMLEVLEALEVMRRVLLRMLEAVEGAVVMGKTLRLRL